MSTGSAKSLDQRLARALAHPLRQSILRILNERVASPKEIADEVGEPLGNVSYHTRILLQSDCIELVRTEPRRGAIEHYYRAIARPVLSDEQWAGLPLSMRRELFAQSIRDIWKDVADASASGGFDDPEVHVSRTPLELDKQGWDEVAALLSRTVDDVLRIYSESVTRQNEAGNPPDGLTKTELALMHFHRTVAPDPPAHKPKRRRSPQRQA